MSNSYLLHIYMRLPDTPLDPSDKVGSLLVPDPEHWIYSSVFQSSDHPGCSWRQRSIRRNSSCSNICRASFDRSGHSPSWSRDLLYTSRWRSLDDNIPSLLKQRQINDQTNAMCWKLMWGNIKKIRKNKKTSL